MVVCCRLLPKWIFSGAVRVRPPSIGHSNRLSLVLPRDGFDDGPATAMWRATFGVDHARLVRGDLIERIGKAPPGAMSTITCWVTPWPTRPLDVGKDERGLGVDGQGAGSPRVLRQGFISREASSFRGARKFFQPVLFLRELILTRVRKITDAGL